MASIVFTKRSATVEADKSIHSQLRLVYFSDGPAYETLHAICKTMAPYFKSYVKEKGKIDRDGDKMAPSVEKKIAELEMGLLHLQQNIDIPEITLSVHPLIQQVIKQCTEEGKKPKVADFGLKVEDSTFLNQLQNGVNRWIKEIQKVSLKPKSNAVGTTKIVREDRRHDYNFWFRFTNSRIYAFLIRIFSFNLLRHSVNPCSHLMMIFCSSHVLYTRLLSSFSSSHFINTLKNQKLREII